MFKENDIVKTNKRINDLIEKYTEGVILSVYDNGKAYLIEFFDAGGNTIGSGMETVFKDDIDLLTDARR